MCRLRRCSAQALKKVSESLNGITNDQKVFREEIKDHRGNYFVGYQPADTRFSFAHLQLTFLDDGSDVAIVKSAMEHELKNWLSRFAVPVMVSAFDAKGDLIHVATGLGQSQLMGYVDPQSGEVIQLWGLLENDDANALLGQRKV